MEGLGNVFPDDLILVIAKYWLKNNNHASVTLRKATARLLSEQHDYKELKPLYIQKLPIQNYESLLVDVPKVKIYETPSSIMCSVVLNVQKTPTLSTHVYTQVYRIVYNADYDSSMWYVHWSQRNSNGIRKYGRHSPCQTFFLNRENKWIE